MALITLLLAGYLLIGILGLGMRSHISFGITLIGVTALILFPVAEWLDVDPEVIFLLGLVVGSSGFLGKVGQSRTWTYRIYQITTLILLGYYAYAVAILPAVYIFALAIILGGFVVYPLLKLLPKEYKEITLKNQVIQAHIFSVVGLVNLVAYYVIYGIV